MKLRQAIDAFRKRTGVHHTYVTLAQQTGIAETTLQSLATRRGYNTRLSTVARLCAALETTPAELLEFTNAPHED